MMVSVRRVAPVLVLLAALPLAAATHAKQSSHPPRDLHRAGDHWTAYNPPDSSTYPATAKTYAIKRGDTLWALAKQFYGNAYLWPQLWETNSWITDAHWIYPGDVLLIQGEAAADTTTRTTSSTKVTTTTPMPEMPTAAPTATVVQAPPIPLATEADLYCFGYIGDPHEPMPNRIDSFEDIEMLYQAGVAEQGMSVATGDLVFVKGGTSTGINAGETYLLVEPGEVIKHPKTDRVLGQHYNFIGQIKILCADTERSRAIITQACREIRSGVRLKPLPQIPIPIARVPDLLTVCDPPSGHANGYIVDSRDYVNLGMGDLIQVDLGRDDQISPGDFLTIYRDSPIEGQPRQVLGEAGILTTEGRTSTARIVSMRRSMRVGDRVESR